MSRLVTSQDLAQALTKIRSHSLAVGRLALSNTMSPEEAAEVLENFKKADLEVFNLIERLARE